MNTPTIDTIFADMTSTQISNYASYWEDIKPTNTDDIFRRWLFAYTSIHTNWAGNVRGYNAIKDFGQWLHDKEILRNKLMESKCGMHNMRTEYIWDFTSDFFANTQDFLKNENESWTELRDRLTNRLRGIGVTKVSFTLEMCFPNEAEVVCLDTHMMQLYGMTTVRNEGKHKLIYQQNEQDWINRSANIESAPYITRCLFWDKKQGYNDSRYWSYVLES